MAVVGDILLDKTFVDEIKIYNPPTSDYHVINKLYGDTTYIAKDGE